MAKNISEGFKNIAIAGVLATGLGLSAQADAHHRRGHGVPPGHQPDVRGTQTFQGNQDFNGRVSGNVSNTTDIVANPSALAGAENNTAVDNRDQFTGTNSGEFNNQDRFSGTNTNDNQITTTVSPTNTVNPQITGQQEQQQGFVSTDETTNNLGQQQRTGDVEGRTGDVNVSDNRVNTSNFKSEDFSLGLVQPGTQISPDYVDLCAKWESSGVSVNAGFGYATFGGVGFNKGEKGVGDPECMKLASELERRAAEQQNDHAVRMQQLNAATYISNVAIDTACNNNDKENCQGTAEQARNFLFGNSWAQPVAPEPGQ